MSVRGTAYFLSCVVAVAVCLASCSGGGGPAVGTPEWYWLAADETFQSADFIKTQEHLGELVDSDSPWRERATGWRVIVLSGLSRGFMELGKAYADGIEEDESLVPQFQNPVQQYRRDARQYAIELAESLGTVHKVLSGDTVTLEFPFPSGSPNPSPVLATIRGGTAPPDSQLAEAQAETLKWGILLQTTEIVGAGEDVNKARSLFGAPPVEVPRTQFFFRLGASLWAISDLFSREQLNSPQVRKIMMQRALDCIGPALEVEDEELKTEAEELKEEIEEEMEKLKV